MFRNPTGIIVMFIVAASCHSAGKIRNADTAFALKQYELAKEMYKAELKNALDQRRQAEIAYRVGMCYKHNADFSQSLKWFKRAYDLDYGPSALEQYAFALKQNEEYEASIRAFQQLAHEIKSSTAFRREINICRQALQWKNAKAPYFYKITAAERVNSLSADYAGFRHPNGFFYFISDRGLSKRKYGWTGRSYHDIWVLDTVLSESIDILPEPLNSKNHEGPFYLSPKSNFIYLTRCDKTELGGNHYCQIYISHSTGRQWAEPEAISINTPNCNTMHPAIHPSKNIMIFSSDRAGGAGKYDLFWTSLTPDGDGTVAEPLPDGINTEGNELFPVFNGDTLYFSSDHLPGMGGLDIFRTYLLSDSSWAAPQRMPWPVNSGADDFYFVKDPFFIPNDTLRQRAWFSSNRNPKNKDDVYLAEEVATSEKEGERDKATGVNFSVFVELQFVETDMYKKGREANKPLDSVYFYPAENAAPILTNRFIKLQILEGQPYKFYFSKKNYLNNSLEFVSAQRPEDLQADSQFVHRFTIELTPLIFNEEFVLKDVYYDFDRFDIREDAKSSLNRLAGLLNANPRINIRLTSHTDCRGDDAYNLTLSMKRAYSAVEYLESQGIARKRLVVDAKGEKDPAVPCPCENCSEEEHQLNRRTTFTLLRL